MSLVISVTNLKGGVGKTTIATNLAPMFAKAGKSVYLIDTDKKQTSSNFWAEVRSETDLPFIQSSYFSEKTLSRSVEDLRKKYDIIIIDGTPQISEISDRAILASDIVIIPILPSQIDINSLGIFLEQYQRVVEMKADIGKKTIGGIVINKFKPNTILGKDIIELFQTEDVGVQLFDATIGDRTIYAEVYASGMGVTESKELKAKKARKEMKALFKEIKKMQ